MKNLPKVGDEIYIPSAFYISRGSDDVVGGLATVSKIKDGFVSIQEFPGKSYSWKYLSERQDDLRTKFGDKRAYADPDIDTPWIEKGDIVDGEICDGEPIW